ncbi:hypothetical protein F5884DRAFT_192093 [Xylogone sp. PMI_703]|nr:hypothetical protein F5884DRAFT_192093 [Xylogone sp. PMI_703]
MPNVSIKRVGSLNSQQVELLTQLLCLPPGQTPTEQWLRDQEFRLQYFPPELVAPKSTLSKLSRKLEFTLKSASDPHLCPTHKVLNPHLIHRIFLLVTDETTRRLGRLARHPGGLPPNVQSFLKRMQMMNSIWMDEGLYRVTFRATPYDARYDKFPTDCEACILASVGGNESLLSDLRAGILGRKRKEQKKNSRLLRIVDGWMDWTGKGDELENSNLVKEIRQCRTLLRAERAKKKKKKKGKPSDKRRRRSVDGASGLTPQPPQGRTKERNERYGRRKAKRSHSI